MARQNPENLLQQVDDIRLDRVTSISWCGETVDFSYAEFRSIWLTKFNAQEPLPDTHHGSCGPLLLKGEVGGHELWVFVQCAVQTANPHDLHGVQELDGLKDRSGVTADGYSYSMAPSFDNGNFLSVLPVSEADEMERAEFMAMVDFETSRFSRQ